MGGEVHVESEVGTGTTFRVHIPVTIVEKDKPVPGEHAAAATASLSGLHILLAEDDLSSQLVAERMLEKLGHTVTCVATGREVLASLEKERFDLVLMDVQMPGMDGTQGRQGNPERSAVREHARHRSYCACHGWGQGEVA